MKLVALIALVSMCCVPIVGYAQGYPWCSSLDEVYAEVDGSTLTVHHDNATYNCCPDSFSYALTASNDTLYIVESENLSNPCDCECCYDLATTVKDLPPGTLQVVFRWFDNDPWVWRDQNLTVVIGEWGQAGSVYPGPSIRSDCLAQVPAAAFRWGVLKSRYQ